MSHCSRFLAISIAFGANCSIHAADAIAYTNAALETAGKAGRIEKGTLVVRGGNIEAAGAHVAIPDGAHVIDAQGKTTMPGIVALFHEVSIAATRSRRRARPSSSAAGPSCCRIVPRAPAEAVRVADNFYP